MCILTNKGEDSNVILILALKTRKQHSTLYKYA